MQTAQKLKTTKDLLAIPDENFKVYELLEGEIFLSEHPSLNHQKIVGNLIFLLDRFLLENPVGKFWFAPGVIFDEYNSAIPDLAFVVNERISQIASGIHIVGAPDLAIEIMSPGSENVRRDQIVKRQTYAKYGVKEYWIVEPIVEVIEITRLQENVLASVGVFRNKDEINSPLLPDLNFTVKDVFRK
jgi:Uma2 family endonuclease